MAPETAREARSRAGGGEVPAVLVMELRPFGGNDTANGACSGGRWKQLSRAGCKAAAVVIALLYHLRLDRATPWRCSRGEKPR